MHIKDSFPELYHIRKPLKPAEIKARLANKQGKEYWRSLDELSQSEEFEEYLHQEFPRQAGEWDDEVGRRTFLKLMGASLALAGVSACTAQPTETVVPYVRQPEEEVPGKPLFFATAMSLAGTATGLLVRSNEGRPTKVEGNPDHPGSLGATDIYAQASILSLYDPDRSESVLNRGEIRAYTAFLADVRSQLDGLRIKQGAGLRFLTETVTSPTLAAQLKDLLTRYPGAKWHQYEPAGDYAADAGARLAFGEPVNVIYRFDRAERVLSLDSDFLLARGNTIRFAREFIAKRRMVGGKTDMNRLYAVETTPSNTGAKADHRFALRPSEMDSFARAVAAAIGVGGVTAPTQGFTHADKITAIAKDLQEHRGKSIVIAGAEQSPAVHALAHLMNQALGNVGQTVVYTEPLAVNPVNQLDSLRELVRDIDAGQVEMLVIVGGNPVYNAPVDLAFNRERLEKVKTRVHLSLYDDETSRLCQWHIPETHYLEAWGDTRAYDGTVSIIQPLIAPLYKGRSAHELLAAFSDTPEKSGYEIVRDYWRAQAASLGGGGDYEAFWRRAVHNGVVEGTAAKEKSVSVRGDFASQPPQQAPASGNDFEIVFRTDPSVFDGRFANNGWLQELPKPLTKLTWDNAVHVSPRTARERFGVEGNHATYKGTELSVPVVRLTYQGRTVTGPLLVQPGHPDNTATIHLGYGRARAGNVGTSTEDNPVGFDAYALRTSDAPWFGSGAQLALTGDGYLLALTQAHFNMEGREIVRSDKLEDLLHHTGEAAHEIHGGAPLETREGTRELGTVNEHGGEHKEPGPTDTLYTGFAYNGYKWGMSIDVTSCVGCNACIVACQAENNIPVVGKEQVARSREMHWLRIDAYFKGVAENPEGVHFMPIPCMHCEQAPCEPVCPVNATVHDAEGNNNMVYNRCVGTRYCSNNCPYKVRRFNFLLYQDFNTPSLKLMRNPEVSVRSRGVMEKCTYCIQRTQWAKIETEKEGRRIRDGEVVTACQGACPTEAIIFGDLNDPQSRVTKLQAEQRNYGLLAELNTRPRTTYLSAVRNPNPELQGA